MEESSFVHQNISLSTRSNQGRWWEWEVSIRLFTWYQIWWIRYWISTRRLLPNASWGINGGRMRVISYCQSARGKNNPITTAFLSKPDAGMFLKEQPNKQEENFCFLLGFWIVMNSVVFPSKYTKRSLCLQQHLVTPFTVFIRLLFNT